MFSSLLFTWLQRAEFYKNLHQEAVKLLPRGNGEILIDIGCGPGLFSILASSCGYNTKGFDTDPNMIKLAKKIAKSENSLATFYVGSVDNLLESVDVISATSLIAVVKNKEQMLSLLWEKIKSKGILLIIEPTDKMNIENVKKIIQNKKIPLKGSNWLKLWAFARQNNIINPEIYKNLDPKSIQYTPLLHGLVGAWIIRKK